MRFNEKFFLRKNLSNKETQCLTMDKKEHNNMQCWVGYSCSLNHKHR